MRVIKTLSLLGLLCFFISTNSFAQQQSQIINQSSSIELQRLAFSLNLVDASLERLKHKVTYDGSYRKIAYPGGDVPNNIGVCTDVVIRAYRKLGIDLQERVHRDMLNSFAQYPNLPKWNRMRPDTNIDHRRVSKFACLFCEKWCLSSDFPQILMIIYPVI